jgi:hypothetical protein
LEQVTVDYDTSCECFKVTDGEFSSSGDAYGRYARPPALLLASFSGLYLTFLRLFTNVSGWNYLEAFAQEEVDSPEDALLYQQGMGFVEGYLTCELIAQYFKNFYYDQFGYGEPTNATLEFIEQNYAYMLEKSDELSEQSDYWFAVKQTVKQLQGLMDGFAAGCPSTPLSVAQFLLLEAFGDLYDINAAFGDSSSSELLKSRPRGVPPKSRNLRSPAFPNPLYTRCSALVKPLPNFEDVSLTRACVQSINPKAHAARRWFSGTLRGTCS